MSKKDPIAPKPYILLGVPHQFRRQPNFATATAEAQRLAGIEVAAFTTYEVIYVTTPGPKARPTDIGHPEYHFVNIREDRNKYTGFGYLKDAVNAALDREQNLTSMYVLKAVAKYKHKSLYAGYTPKPFVPNMSEVIAAATTAFGQKVACPRCGQRATVTGAVSLRCDTPKCPVDVFLQANAGTFATPGIPLPTPQPDRVSRYMQQYFEFGSARAQALYFKAVITELLDAGIA